MRLVMINWKLHEIVEIETDEIHYEEDGIYYRWRNRNSTGLQKVSYKNLLAIKENQN